jgi:hypothetical protein
LPEAKEIENRVVEMTELVMIVEIGEWTTIVSQWLILLEHSGMVEEYIRVTHLGIFETVVRRIVYVDRPGQEMVVVLKQ